MKRITEQLETLRVNIKEESLDQSYVKRFERANKMLDECISICDKNIYGIKKECSKLLTEAAKWYGEDSDMYYAYKNAIFDAINLIDER